MANSAVTPYPVPEVWRTTGSDTDIEVQVADADIVLRNGFLVDK
jgi:hypothetical protein